LQLLFVCCVKAVYFNKYVTYTQRDGNNEIQAGIAYYNNLIKELIANGIQHIVSARFLSWCIIKNAPKLCHSLTTLIQERHVAGYDIA